MYVSERARTRVRARLYVLGNFVSTRGSRLVDPRAGLQPSGLMPSADALGKGVSRGMGHKGGLSPIIGGSSPVIVVSNLDPGKNRS